MKGVLDFKRGDVVVIYRTGDGQGPAEHRSVATSIGVVENIHTIQKYKDEDEFIKECIKFSVFSESELRTIYRNKKNILI